IDASRHTPPAATDGAAPHDPPVLAPVLTRSSWLLFDVYGEFRTILRMFFDHRYRVAWSTYLVTLVLVPLIITSHSWLPLAHLPLLGGLLDKVVDLVLAFFTYKALSREARRYRETVARPAGTYYYS